MAVPTVSNTYTGQAGPTSDTYQKLGQQYSSMIRGAPALKQAVGENLMKTEGLIEPLAEERAKLIEQLYNADKDLKAKYSDPNSPMYIESPLAQQEAINARINPTWGSIEKMNTMIQSRQKVLGDALDRGMELYKAGLEAKNAELQIAKDMAILNQQQTSPAKIKEQAYEDMLYDIQTGENDPNLLDTVMKKYRNILGADTVLQEYNMNSPHGPAKETVAELVSKYRIKMDPTITKAQQQYRNAQEAADLVARIEKEYNAAKRWASIAGTKQPQLAWLVEQIDPQAASFMSNREMYATQLAKKLAGSGYRTQIMSYLNALPTVTTNSRKAQQLFNQLYDEILGNMELAQESAGTYALDRRSPTEYIAYIRSRTPAEQIAPTNRSNYARTPAPASTVGTPSGEADVWVLE